jgi:hypothetical protein
MRRSANRGTVTWSAHQTHTPETRVMEPVHGSKACRLRLIVDKGAITLRDQEDTLDGICCFARKMIFEGADCGRRGEVPHPKRVARLLGLPWRPSGIRRGRFDFEALFKMACMVKSATLNPDSGPRDAAFDCGCFALSLNMKDSART